MPGALPYAVDWLKRNGASLRVGHTWISQQGCAREVFDKVPPTLNRIGSGLEAFYYLKERVRIGSHGSGSLPKYANYFPLYFLDQESFL